MSFLVKSLQELEHDRQTDAQTDVTENIHATFGDL